MIIKLDLPSVKLNFFEKGILKWQKTFHPNYPWRKTNNHWLALVAEIMLQRTRAEQVIPIYEIFSQKYKTPEEYLKEENTKVFQSLGLHWREKQLRNLAKILEGNEIPTNKKTLLTLPGIGDYIASAYLSLHLMIRDVIIDTNVVRIYGRYFGFQTDGETRRKKWLLELAEKLTPKNNFKNFNYGLIDFTRMICKPKPLCPMCNLKTKCSYYLEK